MQTLLTLTDAVRWWAAIAGFIGCHDAVQFMRWRLAGGQSQLHLTSWQHATGVALVSLFFAVTGLTIPLSDRIAEWGGRGGALQNEIMFFAWWIGGVCAWLLVIERGDKQRYMAMVAIGMLPTMTLAAFLTARG